MVHIQKCQSGYGISTMVGQTWPLYVWLKSQILTGNQRKNLAKTALTKVSFLIEKKIRIVFTKYNSFF